MWLQSGYLILFKLLNLKYITTIIHSCHDKLSICLNSIHLCIYLISVVYILWFGIVFIHRHGFQNLVVI